MSLNLDLDFQNNMDEDVDELQDEEIAEPKVESESGDSLPAKVQLNLFDQFDDELEDEDENMNENEPSEALQTLESQSVELIESPEFLEASQAISKNIWDVPAWKSYFEEVEARACGSIPIDEAYLKILHQFPRCAKVWNSFAEYYIENDKFTEAEEIFSKSLFKCRDLDHWMSFLTFKRKRFNLLSPTDSFSTQNKNSMENLYEQAIENIGLSFNSFPLWSNYLKFLREFFSGNYTSIRRTYHRVLEVPLEESDQIWEEYKRWENEISGFSSSSSSSSSSPTNDLLSKMEDIHKRAKSFVKDRKSFFTQIDFHRWAAPPTREFSEIQQLSLWSEWIKREMQVYSSYHLSSSSSSSITSINDASSSSSSTSSSSSSSSSSIGSVLGWTSESPRRYMRMLIDQCLSLFYRHPEAWFALTQFELLTTYSTSSSSSLSSSSSSSSSSLISSISTIHNHYSSPFSSSYSTSSSSPFSSPLSPTQFADLRRIFEESISAVPSSALIRAFWAETLERHDRVEESFSVLKQAFDTLPSGFTFSLYQKMMRRRLGIAAARKVFSDCQIKRKERDIGLQIYLAHAQLELQMNCSPDVCLRVLSHAQSLFPISPVSGDLRFLRLQCTALQRIGDLNQLRIVYQSALDEIEIALQFVVSSDSKRSVSTTLSSWRGYGASTGGVGVGVGSTNNGIKGTGGAGDGLTSLAELGAGDSSSSSSSSMEIAEEGLKNESDSSSFSSSSSSSSSSASSSGSNPNYNPLAFLFSDDKSLSMYYSSLPSHHQHNNSSSSSSSSSVFDSQLNGSETESLCLLSPTASHVEIMIHLKRIRWLISEDWLTAESSLGLAELLRMDELFSMRDRCRREYEYEIFIQKVIRASRIGKKLPYENYSSLMESYRGVGLFEPSFELCERYSSLITSSSSSSTSSSSLSSVLLPYVDQQLKERSQGKKLFNELKTSFVDSVTKSTSSSSSSSSSQSILKDMIVPSVLREFLALFPPHVGSGGIPLASSICLRQIEKLTLPPRPTPVNGTTSEEGEGMGGGITGGKKKAKLMTSGGGGGGGQEDEEDDETDLEESFQDIFRKRQSHRLFGK